jgi:hypothetical protein
LERCGQGVNLRIGAPPTQIDPVRPKWRALDPFIVLLVETATTRGIRLIRPGKIPTTSVLRRLQVESVGQLWDHRGTGLVNPRLPDTDLGHVSCTT